MHITETDWVLQCLDFGVRPWDYYKDKYALWLLERRIGEGMPIGEIKKSDVGFLLNKPALQQICRGLSRGVLTPQDLHAWHIGRYCADAPPVGFRLTLGRWGEYISKHVKPCWYQTSRPGENLVLQINFGEQHDVDFHRLFRRAIHAPFEDESHPVTCNKLNTLGWARLDVDMERGEVLIEEIQNDWLREARQDLRLWQKAIAEDDRNRENHYLRYLHGISFEQLTGYVDTYIKPLEKFWDEAILTAALEFCTGELGIKKVFYHTVQSGNVLKELDSCYLPPVSLYSKLPRRFGFALTDEPPAFLQEQTYLKKVLKTHPGLQWFVLNC